MSDFIIMSDIIKLSNRILYRDDMTMNQEESIESVNDSLQYVIASSQCPRVVFFGDTGE